MVRSYTLEGIAIHFRMRPLPSKPGWAGNITVIRNPGQLFVPLALSYFVYFVRKRNIGYLWHVRRTLSLEQHDDAHELV